jgi:hypothetical protein
MTRAVNTAAVGIGGVIQVVNATYSTQTPATTATYIDTGLTATITPTSTTSKILVFVSVTGIYKTGNANVLGEFNLVRNGSQIIIFEAIGPYNNSASDGNRESMATSTTYLDSPASSSAVVYKVQFRNVTAAGTVQICGNNCASTITLMEIAV